MHVLGFVALVLLTLVGYSSGVTWALRGRTASPRALDLVLVVVLWVLGVSLQLGLGKWRGLGVAVLTGLVVGGAVALLSHAPSSAERGGASESGASSEPGASDGPRPSGLPRAWEAWKRFAARMGNFQGRMTMAFFYFVGLTPFALLSRLAADPLVLERPSGDTFWTDRTTSEDDVEHARKQF